MEQFYDVVDSEGTVVETAAEQKAQSLVATPAQEPIPLDRPQPPLSIGEVKKLRRQHITVTHPRVVACKHRLNLNEQPRLNCESCWFAWFQNHGEIVQQLDEMFQADGGKAIEQLQGKKFLHMWRKFMATIAQWKEMENVK